MREILFRGKRVDNGGWVQGCLVKFGKESFTDEDRYGIMDKTVLVAKLHKDLNRYRTLVMGDCDYIYHNIRIAEIIPKTVGQYTGLTDKNGKKIFEGDIVAQNWYDYNEPADDSFGEVVFCEYDCSFSVMDVQKDGIVPLGRCHAYHWEAEVIDNIHDNPELLEVQNA